MPKLKVYQKWEYQKYTLKSIDPIFHEFLSDRYKKDYIPESDTWRKGFAADLKRKQKKKVNPNQTSLFDNPDFESVASARVLENYEIKSDLGTNKQAYCVDKKVYITKNGKVIRFKDKENDREYCRHKVKGIKQSHGGAIPDDFNEFMALIFPLNTGHQVQWTGTEKRLLTKLETGHDTRFDNPLQKKKSKDSTDKSVHPLYVYACFYNPPQIHQYHKLFNSVFYYLNKTDVQLKDSHKRARMHDPKINPNAENLKGAKTKSYSYELMGAMVMRFGDIYDADEKSLRNLQKFDGTNNFTRIIDRKKQIAVWEKMPLENLRMTAQYHIKNQTEYVDDLKKILEKRAPDCKIIENYESRQYLLESEKIFCTDKKIFLTPNGQILSFNDLLPSRLRKVVKKILKINNGKLYDDLSDFLCTIFPNKDGATFYWDAKNNTFELVNKNLSVALKNNNSPKDYANMDIVDLLRTVKNQRTRVSGKIDDDLDEYCKNHHPEFYNIENQYLSKKILKTVKKEEPVPVVSVLVKKPAAPKTKPEIMNTEQLKELAKGYNEVIFDMRRDGNFDILVERKFVDNLPKNLRDFYDADIKRIVLPEVEKTETKTDNNRPSMWELRLREHLKQKDQKPNTSHILKGPDNPQNDPRFNPHILSRKIR